MDEMRKVHKMGGNFVTWLICVAVEGGRTGIHSKEFSGSERIRLALEPNPTYENTPAIEEIGGEYFLTQRRINMYSKTEGELVKADWTDIWKETTGEEADLNGKIDVELCNELSQLHANLHA